MLRRMVWRRVVMSRRAVDRRTVTRAVIRPEYDTSNNLVKKYHQGIWN